MAKKLIESTPKCSNWNLRATTINTCDNIQARVKIYFRGNNWDLDAISIRKLKMLNQPTTHPHKSYNKLSVLWKHWRYTKANLTIKHKKLYIRDYLQVEDSSSSKTIMQENSTKYANKTITKTEDVKDFPWIYLKQGRWTYSV